MIIGFTGTQQGLTEVQYNRLHELVRGLSPTEAHHGDCIGADATFHKIVASICPVVGHPPSDPRKRAFCAFTTERPTKPYLKRNADIVRESDLLIACPKEQEEQLRSGTWATIREAIRREKPFVIIYPDGRVHADRATALLTYEQEDK